MRTAEGDGAIVLLGRCVDVGDGELAYAPIASALRSLPALVDEPELTEVLGEGRRELARLAPASGAPEPAVAAGPATYGKERLFESVLGAAGPPRRAAPGGVGGRGPALGRRLHAGSAPVPPAIGGRERLVLIVTCRADDIDRAHPVRPYLVELRRDSRVLCVEVEPFSRPRLRRPRRRGARGAAEPIGPRRPVREVGGQRLLHRGVAGRGRHVGAAGLDQRGDGGDASSTCHPLPGAWCGCWLPPAGGSIITCWSGRRRCRRGT